MWKTLPPAPPSGEAKRWQEIIRGEARFSGGGDNGEERAMVKQKLRQVLLPRMP